MSSVRGWDCNVVDVLAIRSMHVGRKGMAGSLLRREVAWREDAVDGRVCGDWKIMCCCVASFGWVLWCLLPIMPHEAVYAASYLLSESKSLMHRAVVEGAASLGMAQNH